MKNKWIGFFFSSRRRHTRYWRDWSSDVCSSDLPSNLTRAFAVHARTLELLGARGLADDLVATGTRVGGLRVFGQLEVDLSRLRSEERRVGKERRSRWSPDH